MYINLDSNNKLVCEANCFPHNIKFEGIFDTGAGVTCLDFAVSGILWNGRKKDNPVNISGVNPDSPVRFWPIEVKQLVIEHVILIDQIVYVTNFKDARWNIIGMNVLSQLDFAFSAEKQQLLIKDPLYSRVNNRNCKKVLYDYLNKTDRFSPEAFSQVLSNMPEKIEMSVGAFKHLTDICLN